MKEKAEEDKIIETWERNENWVSPFVEAVRNIKSVTASRYSFDKKEKEGYVEVVVRRIRGRNAFIHIRDGMTAAGVLTLLKAAKPPKFGKKHKTSSF